MKEDVEALLKALEKQNRIARNPKLSLSAKGLFLVLGKLQPFAPTIDGIIDLCNSNRNEIYAAFMELLAYRYITFGDVQMFLGIHDE